MHRFILHQNCKSPFFTFRINKKKDESFSRLAGDLALAPHSLLSWKGMRGLTVILACSATALQN